MLNPVKLTMLSNRYQIREELGRGGMGVVYRASDTLLGREVAIKVVSKSDLDTQGRARLMSEAQAAARLNHPGIITVYDVGEADGLPFIVMELIEGKPLNAFEAELAVVLAYCAQVCEALEAAHGQGIIHRDLKPENVLVTSSGTVKLMDFGLARQAEAPRLTTDGAVVGTVSYMAPELLTGSEPTAQSDLYALGVMLYEFATGRPLFEGGDMVQQLTQHLYATVVPPSTINPAIPDELENLILRLLEKQPGARPKSAAEVGAILSRLAVDRPYVTSDAQPVEPVGLLSRMVRGRLVAREGEVAEAVAAWQRALSGRSSLLLISGEPGIGKTRMVRELIARVGFADGQALIGACYAEGSMPYGPYTEIIPNALQAATNGTEIPLDPLTLAELVQIAPALGSNFPDLKPNPPIDPQAAQLRAFESVLRLVSHVAKTQPLLLVLDDVHWADSSTLALTRHILRRAAHQALKLLIVMTYRETDLDEMRALNEILAEVSREPNTLRIKLTRFTREQTGAMLAALFAEAITPEFLEGIYRETEGNPFFIEEVCKALIDSGQLTRVNGRWQRPDMQDLVVPQNVRTAIESRLRRMPEQVQEVLRLASVFGREFYFEALNALSELDEDRLIDALEYAERAQTIGEVRGTRGPVKFAFSHALIPASLQEGISTLRRQRMHRKALAVLKEVDPSAYDRLAYHAVHGADEENAREFLFLAGKRALEKFSTREAIQYLQQAIEIENAPVRNAEILRLLGDAEIREGTVVEGLGHLEQAAAVYLDAGQPDEAARAASLQISAIWTTQTSATEAAKNWAIKVLGWPDGPGVGELCHEICRVLIFADQFSEEFQPLFERAESIARDFDLFDLELHLAATVAFARLNESETAGNLEDILARAEVRQYVSEASLRVINNLAVNYIFTRGIAEALVISKRHLAAVRRMGLFLLEIFSLLNIAGMQLELGFLDEAAQTLALVRKSLDAADYPGLEDTYTSHMARLRFYTDGPRAVISVFKTLYEEGSDWKNVQEYYNLGTRYADVLITAGDLAAAEQVCKEMLENSLKMDEVVYRAFVLITTAMWLYALETRPMDWEEQLASLQAVADDLRGRSLILSTRTLLGYFDTIALALHGRWEESLKIARETEARFAAAGWLMWQARLMFFASRIAVQVDQSQARELAEGALKIFQQAGATWFAEQVQEELKLLPE